MTTEKKTTGKAHAEGVRNKLLGQLALDSLEGGATAKQLVETTRLKITLLRAALNDLVKRGEVKAVSVEGQKEMTFTLADEGKAEASEKVEASEEAEPAPTEFWRTVAEPIDDKGRLVLATKMSDVLTQISAEREKMETARKVSAMHKKAIDTHTQELEKLNESYTSGEVDRRVKCREDKCFETNTVYVRRLDTDEAIEERSMRADERQREIFPAPAEKPAQA